MASVPGHDPADSPRPVPGDQSGERSLIAVLLTLTMLSGVVDAVCYLGLGRVFTANMTGNVVVLGFAAAGAPGFSVTASLTSLGCFLAGAVAGGILSRRVARRSRLLVTAIGLEAVFVAAASIVAFAAATVATGWARYTAIAILAIAMGVRNSVIRRLAIPDMTTTVLTMTLTGLAADSSLAGGSNPRAGRRSAAVLAMLIGAFAGAALYLHRGAALPLAIAAAAAGLAAIAVLAGPAASHIDKE
ncbi:MAG: YoaK family protein [Streptosporangiaceae bacterium]